MTATDVAPLTVADITQRRAEADKLLTAGDLAAAEAAYCTILTVEPNNIYALMGLGNVARAAKNLSLAEQRYTDAATIHPRSTWPLFVLIDLHAMQKQWDQGEAMAVRSFALKPDEFYTTLALGRLRRARGDEAAALAAFEIAVAADPKSFGARVEVGRSLIALDRLEEADNIYRIGLELSAPEQHLGLFRALANLARKRNDLVATVEWLRRAAASAPTDLALQLEVAKTQIEVAKAADDKPAIRVALEAALKLSPDNVPTMIELATLHRDASELDEAQALYDRVLALKPDNLSSLLGIAAIARRRGQLEQALALFQQTFAAHPKNSWVPIEVGRSLRDVGRLDEAETTLRLVSETNLHYRFALATLADIARERGDGTAALELIKQSAAVSPDPITALVNAANHALGNRSFDDAHDLAREIAKRDPRAMQAPLIEGRIHRAKLDRSAAQAAFARAVELAPDDATPRVELAAEYSALGQSAAAEEQLDAALALEPEHLQALLQRAERYRAAKDTPSAIALLRRARAAQPTLPWPYLNEAQLVAAEGETDEACRLLGEGRAACGPLAQFFAREANILQDAGFLDRARDLLDEGWNRYPKDSWIWSSRCSVAITLGDFEKAEHALANAPGTSPADEARALVLRAKMAEAHWRIEEARRHLNAAILLDPTNATAAQDLAKLSLFSFDLPRAKQYLTVHAGLQSAATNAAGRSPNITQSQLGQIYDEFALDPRLVGTIAALNRQDEWARIAGLLEIVRRNPGSTAAALGILIALRQTGAFARSSALDGQQRPLIPRAICQYWDGAEPPTDIRGMIDGWVAAHPDHRHTLYNDTTALQFLRDHGTADVPTAFLKTRDRAQRADLFRMAYLYARGGIYIDADDRCRGTLEHVIKPGDALVVFQEDYGSIANNFIAVAPAHPMIKRALTQATEAILRGDRDIVWLSTGPGMFSRAIAAEISEPAIPIDRALQNITVLDRHIIRRALVPYCQASYKRTVRHWQNTAFPSASAVKPKSDAKSVATLPNPSVT